MTNLTKYEVETVVNYNAGEQTATVYTSDKSVMQKTADSIVYPEKHSILACLKFIMAAQIRAFFF